MAVNDRWAAIMPIDRVDLTIKFVSVDVLEALEAKLKDPALGSGIELTGRPEYDELQVRCDNWANVDRLKRLTDKASVEVHNRYLTNR